MHETFFSLLRDAAHWEFEIFLMVLFDGIILGILYPFVSKHLKHHLARDKREAQPIPADGFLPLSVDGLQPLSMYSLAPLPRRSGRTMLIHRPTLPISPTLHSAATDEQLDRDELIERTEDI